MAGNNVLDSVIPPDFPREVFNATSWRVYTANEQKFHSPYADDFIDAFNAVGYRFFTCAEHDKSFTDSIIRAGINPPRLEHYIQERELFGFFISGLACLESFAYSCYALGAILNKNNFPMNKPRSITIVSTVDKFNKYYKDEPLSEKLNELNTGGEFKNWSEVRNILAHRLMPARLHKITIYLGQPNSQREVTWINDIQINNLTTSSRREWLARILSELLNQTELFTKKYFTS